MSIRSNTLFSILLAGLFTVGTALFVTDSADADNKLFVKDRKKYKKSVRTRMPPQFIIENLQKSLNAKSSEWDTFWQSFVIEDEDGAKEFLFIARSVEKPWAFGLLSDDCIKPQNFAELDKQVFTGGTPVRMDIMIGIRKKRSFFRYVVKVYEPMYSYWDNPCYVWNLPPGKADDEFYNKNYNMKIYSENIKKEIYKLARKFRKWKPPKKVRRIPKMKGAGVELVGGEASGLTDEERNLPIEDQEKILKKRSKSKKWKFWGRKKS